MSTSRFQKAAGAKPTTGAKIIPLQSGRHAAPAKRAYVKLSDEMRERVTRELLTLAAEGRLDPAEYQRVHLRTGASVSQLEKLVRQAQRNAAQGRGAVPNPRVSRTSKIEVTEDVLLCHVGRDMTSAHLLAMATGLVPPCHRTTYSDAVRAEKGDGFLKALRYGQRVLPQQWVYLDRRDNPLMDVVTIDLFFPRVRTLRPDGTTGVPVWVFVRERSRGVLLAWKQFERAPRGTDDVTGDPDSGPDSAAILALLGEAFRGWYRDGVHVGGKPRALRCDREALFLTELARTELAALDIEVDPTNSYSSWENGAHERMHQVIRREALQGLPASNDGPQTRSKQLHFADATISSQDLADRMDRWALSYNFERCSEQLGGLTPFASWVERVEAGDPVDRLSNRELAALSLPAGIGTKQKAGILAPNGHTYSGPKLVGVRNGTAFSLGVWLNDQRHLEVFDAATGTYLMTLERTSDMSPQTEGQILGARHRQRETVDALLAEARRRFNIEQGPTPQRPTPASDPGDGDGPATPDGPPADGPPADGPPAGSPHRGDAPHSSHATPADDTMPGRAVTAADDAQSGADTAPEDDRTPLEGTAGTADPAPTRGTAPSGDDQRAARGPNAAAPVSRRHARPAADHGGAEADEARADAAPAASNAADLHTAPADTDRHEATDSPAHHPHGPAQPRNPIADRLDEIARQQEED